MKYGCLAAAYGLRAHGQTEWLLVLNTNFPWQFIFMKHEDVFSPWCGRHDESAEKLRREKEREREQKYTPPLCFSFFSCIPHNARRTLIIYLASQELWWTEGGKKGQSEKRPVVFTRNQFVLLRGNIGWRKKKYHDENYCWIWKVQIQTSVKQRFCFLER